MVRIVPVQIRHKGACIADRSHERRNFRRRLVAARRLPARTPAKSAVTAWTDVPSRLPRPLSTHSRTSAATERPVERACCLSCRSVGPGSLIVMPLISAILNRNSLLSDQQYHPIIRLGRPAGARLQPQANGVAERFVRTVRSECFDWLLILNQQHLEGVLAVFVDHYDGHRPHRALALAPPQPTRPPIAATTEWGEVRVQRGDRLGGVVREYVLAA